MSGVILYMLLLLLLELMILMLLSSSGDEHVLFWEDTDDTGCDFVPVVGCLCRQCQCLIPAR